MSSPRYWREIPQRYRFEGAKCKGCGKVYFPPRLICPECQSKEFEHIQLKKDGKVLYFCSPKCEKSFKMKRDPRKRKWTRTSRKLRGKE